MESKLENDTEIHVTDMQLLTKPDLSGFTVRCQTVDQHESGPARSGKFLRLTMTPKDAVILRDILAEALKSVPPGEVILHNIPPRGEKN